MLNTSWTALRPTCPSLLLILFFALAACRAPLPTESAIVPDGNPQRGHELLTSYGCVSCHAIPGTAATTSFVGPPLDSWAQRNILAGQFANTPVNLVAWIHDPQQMKPGSAMPSVGASMQDARDIAAYLYTLGEPPLHWLNEDEP